MESRHVAPEAPVEPSGSPRAEGGQDGVAGTWNLEGPRSFLPS